MSIAITTHILRPRQAPMISQKRKQAGANAAQASQKRARHAAGLSSATSQAQDGPGDIDGDLDLDEQDRKRTQQGRKGRVVTEGYDSDESAEIAGDSDDNEDDADEDADDGKAAKDEDDDDIFALGDEDEEGRKAKSKKKPKEERFLKPSQIEGQEFEGKTKVGDEDAEDFLSDEEDEDRDFDLELEDDDEEGADEPDDDEDNYQARAERTPPPDGAEDGEDNPDEETQNRRRARAAERKAKSKRGMGHKLDEFNMRAEFQTGRFDEDGTYVANSADPHAQHDSWLEGNYSRKKIRAAREAQRKREQELEAKEKAKRSVGSSRDLEVEGDAGGIGGTGAVTEAECTIAMVKFMHRGESVLETLQRLGKAAKVEAKAKSTSLMASAVNEKHGPGAGSHGKYAGKGDAKKRALALDEEADPGAGSSTTASKSDSMDVDPIPASGEQPTAAEIQQRERKAKAAMSQKSHAVVALEQFTALSSEIMSTYGQIHIYDETYESILRVLKRKRVVPNDFDPASSSDPPRETAPVPSIAPTPVAAAPPDPRHFIYRWAPAYLAATQGANASPDIETYGPFPASSLREWAVSGYFGAPGQCERILLKPVSTGSDANGSGAGAGRWQTWSEAGL
ncbi:hypothetical protein OC846_001203 [Tilletia horrida]|uniref:GYF domain-containing protein n=1 Tax=Tilletia horrida TaxID=155126 RepID=A0AAN6GUD5_9BASI|nr:hypothetical protein OC845_000233 [Tilletia horrida]KAK0556380.1 hypothetical protein OC846_001203 [Tilletia horrida]